MRASCSISRPILLGVLIVLFQARSLCGADGRVVINEVMYHPPDDLDNLQFIELFNAGESAADLSGWSFGQGVKFTFASGTKLAPGAFLVVCRKRADFAERYGAGCARRGRIRGQAQSRRRTTGFARCAKADRGRDGLLRSCAVAVVGRWRLGLAGADLSAGRRHRALELGARRGCPSSRGRPVLPVARTIVFRQTCRRPSPKLLSPPKRPRRTRR